MSFIRPEAQETLRRWRLALVGLGTIALGAWWTGGVGGLLGWIGWPVMAAGVALTIVGIQRARFDNGHDGPGLVDVDEAEVTYYGPLSGGSVAVGDIARLIFDPTSHPPCWVLVATDNTGLHIPVNAEGADALFEVFSTLPGLRTSRLLTEMRAGNDQPGGIPTVIWDRQAEIIDRQRLN